jgi:hypothetical protein
MLFQSEICQQPPPTPAAINPALALNKEDPTSPILLDWEHHQLPLHPLMLLPLMCSLL